MITSQEKTTNTLNSLNECDEGEKANLPYQQINPQKMQEFLEHTQLLMQFRNLGLTNDLKYIEQEDIEKTNKKMKELGIDQFSKTFSHKEMMQGQCFKLRDLQKQLVQQNQNYKNYSEFEEAPLEEKQEIMQLLVDTQRQILEKVHYPYKERADNYFFPILQKEKINDVEKIFQMPLNEQNKNQKLNQNTDITFNDLKTLNGLVNDNVINKYLELINQDVVYPKKTMNSYFFQFLNNQEVDWKKIFRIADRKKSPMYSSNRKQIDKNKQVYKKKELYKKKKSIEIPSINWAEQQGDHQEILIYTNSPENNQSEPNKNQVKIQGNTDFINQNYNDQYNFEKLYTHASQDEPSNKIQNQIQLQRYSQQNDYECKNKTLDNQQLQLSLDQFNNSKETVKTKNTNKSQNLNKQSLIPIEYSVLLGHKDEPIILNQENNQKFAQNNKLQGHTSRKSKQIFLGGQKRLEKYKKFDQMEQSLNRSRESYENKKVLSQNSVELEGKSVDYGQKQQENQNFTGENFNDQDQKQRQQYLNGEKNVDQNEDEIQNDNNSIQEECSQDFQDQIDKEIEQQQILQQNRAQKFRNYKQPTKSQYYQEDEESFYNLKAQPYKPQNNIIKDNNSQNDNYNDQNNIQNKQQIENHEINIRTSDILLPYSLIKEYPSDQEVSQINERDQNKWSKNNKGLKQSIYQQQSESLYSRTFNSDSQADFDQFGTQMRNQQNQNLNRYDNQYLSQNSSKQNFQESEQQRNYIQNIKHIEYVYQPLVEKNEKYKKKVGINLKPSLSKSIDNQYIKQTDLQSIRFQSMQNRGQVFRSLSTQQNQSNQFKDSLDNFQNSHVQYNPQKKNLNTSINQQNSNIPTMINDTILETINLSHDNNTTINYDMSTIDNKNNQQRSLIQSCGFQRKRVLIRRDFEY
ncbi:hypothetical protein PPERSA_05985 [Pseudocohnilembus persalinus]|uniref:Uncharacterized protein n=1 Tax=Pseudocohnilembus persalinus TaxID=266149 RepID=A0A0V0R4B1_PSEPJ|nr:hypothetical protein PPERSA_05985 [Pseudocohnilembus persalinus]|eukprot:KRX09316.1 hypothetical protein PPERSA_05985 [Pseudocohnilembus persalinus]